MQLPRVSIITPSYNQAQFLGQAIESVLDQGSDVAEYLVLDGGSTDASKEIIERHAPRLSHWRSQKDGGQASAIDEGVRRATSEIVGWLNSDDVLVRGAVAKVREAFARDPELGVVLGWVAVIDEQGRVLRIRRPPPQTYDGARWGALHVAQPACFFRKALYEQVGGIDLSYHCVLDTELWLRMLTASARWGHVPHVLAGFRIHPDSKGQAWSKRYAEEQQRLEVQHPEFFRPRAKLKVGVSMYRLMRTLSLGYVRDFVATRRLHGRPLSACDTL